MKKCIFIYQIFIWDFKNGVVSFLGENGLLGAIQQEQQVLLVGTHGSRRQNYNTYKQRCNVIKVYECLTSAIYCPFLDGTLRLNLKQIPRGFMAFPRLSRPIKLRVYTPRDFCLRSNSGSGRYSTANCIFVMSHSAVILRYEDDYRKNKQYS